MPNHGLTERQLGIIKEVLAPYAQRIERVGLFGSRAMGTAKPYSDIDMVLYGIFDEALIDRLWTLFDSSDLPLKVDINAYNLIAYPPLKQHIDATMQILFTQSDLTNPIVPNKK